MFQNIFLNLKISFKIFISKNKKYILKIIFKYGNTSETSNPKYNLRSVGRSNLNNPIVDPNRWYLGIFIIRV